jgi:hypothetical protein
VVIVPLVDLKMPLPMALAWKRDNTSPLLARFIADVQRLPEVQVVNKIARYAASSLPVQRMPH